MPCQCLEWQQTQRPQWRETQPLARSAVGEPAAALGLVGQGRHGRRRRHPHLQGQRVAVPEDVAVLGVGNDALLCEFSDVPLSSIELDWEAIVYHAAAMLQQLMSGRRPAQEPLVFPPRRVVTRTSSDILGDPGSDWLLPCAMSRALS